MNFYSRIEQGFPQDQNRMLLETESGHAYSWRDLDQQTARFSVLLVNLGLKPGDRVASQVEKSPEALFLYLACLRAGMIYLPMNTAYQADEVDYIIGNAEPGLIVCSPELAPTVASIAEKHGVSRVLTLASNGTGTWIEQATIEPGVFQTHNCADDDVACIVYTSGTTGRPKGAMITHGNLAANARDLVKIWEFSSKDILIHALPIFHVHGLFVASHCVLLSGAKMLWFNRFDPLRVIREFSRATVLMGVPTFYTRLLPCPELSREACASMRLFISGSAPLLSETFREFEARTGAIILERYGMTETGMNTSNPLRGERRAGTVGFPLPSVSVRVATDENRESLGDSGAGVEGAGVVDSAGREDVVDGVGLGPIGVIQVRGPNVFKGYWKMNREAGSDFTSDGWFITGDLGRIDRDSYVHIVGRAKDLIITGGYNVYPKEIETILDKLDGVEESAVIGLPHPDFGEAVTAVVKRSRVGAFSEPENTSAVAGSNGGTGDPDEARLLTALKGRIAGYKIPKRFYFVDELPRNAMGKVQKNILRTRFSKA
jgi:malonyl-CoA/methylmalonyl-CoA synthetase